MSELARKMGIKGRAYQKAKGQLVENGYVHEWRNQGEGGRWLTEQLVANNPLTGEQAGNLRGAPLVTPPVTPPPSAQIPAVGRPDPRSVGGCEPAEDLSDKPTPHPPAEAETEAGREAAIGTVGGVVNEADSAQLARAERVLLSLPLFDETECPSCRIAAAAEHEPEPIPWRERVARINGPSPHPSETPNSRGRRQTAYGGTKGLII
ncbi:hypothetical protein [Streptomyces sp. NPDC004728]|uniref:hypothetical protein n=1 Tax=Streptomyces sp. NPDC004728 TaxID=3154289 RepID=UPI0033BC31DA